MDKSNGKQGGSKVKSKMFTEAAGMAEGHENPPGLNGSTKPKPGWEPPSFQTLCHPCNAKSKITEDDEGRL